MSKHNESALATKILRCCGWNPIIQYKKSLSTTEGWIGCLSHTAGMYELFLWLLYLHSNDLLKHTCILMTETKARGRFPYKNILEHVNAIFLSQDRWKKNMGYVSRIVHKIQEKGYKICILAPSGRDNKPLPWRTGYYYIAKSLGWDLRVVGFDFETKRLKVGTSIPCTYPIDIVQSFLQTEMADIVPYRPHNSSIPIRLFNVSKHSFVKLSPLLYALIISLIVLFIILKKHTQVRLIYIVIAVIVLIALFPNIC